MVKIVWGRVGKWKKVIRSSMNSNPQEYFIDSLTNPDFLLTEQLFNSLYRFKNRRELLSPMEITSTSVAMETKSRTSSCVDHSP